MKSFNVSSKFTAGAPLYIEEGGRFLDQWVSEVEAVSGGVQITLGNSCKVFFPESQVIVEGERKYAPKIVKKAKAEAGSVDVEKSVEAEKTVDTIVGKLKKKVSKKK